MIEALRTVAAVLWLCVAVLLSGSVYRGMVDRASLTDRDPSWTIAFFFAVHQLGFAARWRLGFASQPEHETDVALLTGFIVLSIMIAAAVLTRRILIGGWRW